MTLAKQVPPGPYLGDVFESGVPEVSFWVSGSASYLRATRKRSYLLWDLPRSVVLWEARDMCDC